MGPRFKVARHLGENVFNHPKALKRGIKNHRKLSEYGKRLLEKQKLKAYYGLLERQFRRYVREAMRAGTNPGEVLLQNLERRLDALVYRLGFASSMRQARQMVVHGHILVNGARVDRPSYRVEVGDLISLKESSRKNELFAGNFQSSENTLGYLEKNIDDFSGRLLRIPSPEEIPVNIQTSLIIEFYSR